MGVTRRRRRSRHHHRRLERRLSFATVTALAFLLFAASTSAVSLNPTRQLSRGLREEGEETHVLGLVTRRRLIGPGSSPPTCRSKCGECRPCKPVHVPIQPGFSVPLEYYPEAWRCKCGNKLFMP